MANEHTLAYREHELNRELAEAKDELSQAELAVDAIWVDARILEDEEEAARNRVAEIEAELENLWSE